MAEEIKTTEAEVTEATEETTTPVEATEEVKENNETTELSAEEVVEIEKEIEQEQEAKKVEDVVDTNIDEKSKKTIKADTIKPGMHLKIYQRITEIGSKGEEKSRLQMFEGLCIARKHGNQAGGTFTVRKVTKTGHIIEKIYPIYLPTLEKIELYKTYTARKSKLYFVRKENARKLKAAK